MSTTARLYQQTVWSGLPLIVVTALNLFSVPLFFHYLGAEKYALWLYVITVGGAFGFADLGLGVAVGRYIGVALGRGDRAAVASYWATANIIALPLLMGMGLAFTLLGVFLGPKWFPVDPSTEPLLRWCFVAGGLNLVLGFYGQFWAILSQAHLDFKFLSIVRLATSVGQIVPAIVLARVTADPLVLIGWTAVVGILQLFALMAHGTRRYNLWPFSTPFSKSRAVEMSHYTVKVFLNLVCGSLFGTVDRLLVGRFALAADFAAYNIAANAGSRLQGLSQALMGPVFHNTNRVATEHSDRPAIRQIYSGAFNPLFGLCFIAVTVSLLWRDALLLLWLGPTLAHSVEPVFVPLMIAFALQAISSLSSAQLASLDRQGLVLAFQLAGAVVALGGVWLGWRIAGLPGAAYGVLVSRLVGVVQDLTLSTLVDGGGWLSLSAWRIGAGVAGIALLCFGGSYILKSPTPFLSACIIVLHAILASGFVLVCVRSEFRSQNISNAQ
jgi:O-antigen/teichoic acid export membrane protein